MDIFAILLLLILVVVVAGFLIKPFRSRDLGVWQEDLILSELLSERERLLDALVELDFDNDLQKVPEEIYTLQRKALLVEAAEIMKTLEQQYPQRSSQEAIEEQVASHRAHARGQSDGDDALEKMIGQRRAARGTAEKKPAAGKFCPECGQPIQPGDRFCTSCGTKL